MKYSIWGSNRTRIKKWQINDYLVLIVDKALACLAKVSGKPFASNERIWDNGLFPNRIPIEFLHIPSKESRPSVEHVEDALVAALGKNYYWGIVLQKVITGSSAESVARAIYETQNDLTATINNIETLISRSKLSHGLNT